MPHWFAILCEGDIESKMDIRNFFRGNRAERQVETESVTSPESVSINPGS